MDNKTYYGTEDSKVITYLEFGEIDITNSKKKIWNFQLHQKAYDWLMLGRYANDLQTFITMQNLLKTDGIQKCLNKYNEEVHHSDEAALNLSKIIALAISNKNNLSFYELGQTIFGCIDGMEFYLDLLANLNININLNLKEVDWYGVDISKMFNQLSSTFHKDYKIICSDKKDKLPKKMDVFFSKGITLLYDIRSLDDLFNTLDSCRISIFDYSFSINSIHDTTIGSGKTVRYLVLSEFISRLKLKKEKIFIKKGNSKLINEKGHIWLDCVYGEESLCKSYIKMDVELRQKIANSFKRFKNYSNFLNNDTNPEWIPLEDYVSELGLLL